MCDVHDNEKRMRLGVRTIPVGESVGMVLAHDITEIRQDETKGPAFRKGHVVGPEDIERLQRLGKDNLFVLELSDDEMHEDEAALTLASSLMGEGLVMKGEPKEGKVDILAARDGLLKVDKDALLQFNMLGDVMCATLHANTVVREGQLVAGTRAIPLVVKKTTIEEALRCAGKGVIEVKEIRRPKVGVVITGNEVYYGRITDAFAPVIRRKIEEVHGEIVGIYYAPDDEAFIESRLRELMDAGADLLITTGGMSVDPDDVTRFAIRRLGAEEITYGSSVLPGAMFLVAYLEKTEDRRQMTDDRSASCESLGSDFCLPSSDTIPILGIPACGMYHKTTIFDLVLPRVLTGERIGRRELAEMGHGGLCMSCPQCTYPVCPFGK